MNWFIAFSINFLVFINGLVAEEVPQAEFLVEVSRNQVHTCECYVTTASLVISPDNRVPLQFYDLDKQYSTIIRSLVPESAWVHNAKITEIKKTDKYVGGRPYQQYKIIEVGVCPTQPGEFKIPALELFVAKTDKEGAFLDSLFFKSEPQTIAVLPISVNTLDSLYTNDFYQMVGEFKIEGDFEPKGKKFQIGDTINYEFSIVGRGITFPIGLNLYPAEGVDIIQKAAHVKDTIVFNKLSAKKTFELQIVSRKAGILHLGDYVRWHYFSIKDQQVKVVKPDAWFFTWGNSVPPPPKYANPKIDHDLVVILDISESMYIEDYGTNRITKGIELVNYILKDKKETPLVVFAGKATTLQVDQISHSIMRFGKERGTSIGDAIWEGKELLKNSNAPQKKMLLICDGDNTSGTLSEIMAAQITKSNNITINCIGIGYQGIVPYGYDLLGQRRFVDNSYQDTSLKKVAEITEGKFVHLEREGKVEEVIRAIME